LLRLACHPKESEVSAVTFATRIACTPDRVFDLLSDITRNAEWSPGFAGAEKTTAGPIGVGTGFTTVAKGIGALQIEIEEYDRPTRLGFCAHAKPAQIRHRFTITPDAKGTRVAQRIEVLAKGRRRLIAPVMALMLKKTIRRNTSDLTAYLEAS
jgi:uncharacterized protein YndB with AHSA1/START domain